MIVTEHLRAPFAVLAGAGISYAPPSSLPKAIDFSTAVLDVLSVTQKEKEELLAATSPSWPDGVGYYHFLRFEQLVETLQLTIDPKLSIVGTALPPTVPNQNHFLLARLLNDGFPILTTNYDTLIEDACHASGIACHVLASEEEYEAYHRSRYKPTNILFKLHGTIRNASGVPSLSLNAGISDVTTQLIMSPRKWEVAGKVLDSHDLLVIGYSGSDDFDVMRQINYAQGGRRLCWINHKDASPSQVYSGLRNSRSLLRHPDRKLAWFFNRMFLSLDYQFGRISRQPEGVIVIDGDTKAVLTQSLIDLRKNVPPVERDPSPMPRLRKENITSAISQSLHKANLIAGRLFQHIGRYEKAIDYMHRFLRAESADPPFVLTGRAHLWIARMMDERCCPVAAQAHFKRAFQFLRHAGPLHWTDINTLEALTPYAGYESWVVNSFVAFRVETESGEYQKMLMRRWLVGRQLLTAAKRFFGEENLESASDTMKSLVHEDFTLDDELRADIAYWRAVLRSIEEDEDRRSDATHMAEAAAHTYERLQCLSKWIDALIFVAEQDLPAWADTGYVAASTASELCEFIGNDFSASHALRLKADASEILSRRGNDDLHGIPLESPILLRKSADEASKREKAMARWTCCSVPKESLQL